MPAGRPQFTKEKSYGGETYEQIYAQELKPVPMEEFEAMGDEEGKLAKSSSKTRPNSASSSRT